MVCDGPYLKSMPGDGNDRCVTSLSARCNWDGTHLFHSCKGGVLGILYPQLFVLQLSLGRRTDLQTKLCQRPAIVHRSGLGQGSLQATAIGDTLPCVSGTTEIGSRQLRSRGYLDDSDAAGQLGDPLAELLRVVHGVRL